MRPGEGLLILSAMAVWVGCLPPRAAAVSTSDLGALSDGGVGSSCDELRELWAREVRQHVQCTRDIDCMPTGLVHTHYECTAVNGQWWESERGRLASVVGACERIHTVRPSCCVVSCDHGECKSYQQSTEGMAFCTAEGTCAPSSRCELDPDRLWCGTAIPAGLGYCVKRD